MNTARWPMIAALVGPVATAIAARRHRAVITASACLALPALVTTVVQRHQAPGSPVSFAHFTAWLLARVTE